MGHRRKMLKACTKLAEGKLAEIDNWNDIFAEANIDPKKRPEELGADEYILLSNLCGRQIC